MRIESTFTRRALLVAGAGGAGAVVLAACSGGGSGGSTSDAKAQPSDASTAPAAPAATTSAADAGSSAASAGGAALAALDDIEVGSSKSVKLSDGKPAIITRTAQSSVVCFSAVCTHEGCTVKPAGAKLDCPCHGSMFDAKTGKVLGGPAPSPLPQVAVKVEGSNIVAT